MTKDIRKNFRLFVVLFFLLINFFIFYAVQAESPGELQVYFLDIGQGDAIFIKSPAGNKMLIDGGPPKSNLLREISKILPFYDREIDVIIATHPDQDHIGGLPEVLRRFNVKYVIESGAESGTRIFKDWEMLRDKEKAEKILALRGMNIDLGVGVNFLIFFPDRDVSSLDSNDASIVGKLIFGRNSFFLTGDSPQKIEDFLVFLDGNNLKSDILKAGHHGSKTSSSESFVKTVKPKSVIISAGKNNKYGHPHEEVLEILEEGGIEILSTAQSGSILFKSDKISTNQKIKN